MGETYKAPTWRACHTTFTLRQTSFWSFVASRMKHRCRAADGRRVQVTPDGFVVEQSHRVRGALVAHEATPPHPDWANLV